MFAMTMLGLMLGLKHFAPHLSATLTTVAVGMALSGISGLDRLGISPAGTDF